MKAGKEKGTAAVEAREITMLGPSAPGSLLEPVASDEALVAAFKRYVALKDKLLEESDYVWFSVYKITDEVKRKGFSTRAEAEKFIKELKAKGAQADLEKKVKKSGCLKLGKAFGISTEIIEEQVDRVAGYAYYKTRAKAPNGQYTDRTGSCDRTERGRKESPIDHIEATALTRATDRAIMALLGGENTAEEFEEASASQEAVAATSQGQAKAKEPPKEPEANPKPPKGSESKPEASTTKPLTEKEKLEAIDAKFAGVKPSSIPDQLRGRLFRAAKDAGVTTEVLKAQIKKEFKVESTNDLTGEQLHGLIRRLEARAKKAQKGESA